jgi:hypothetical protein
MRGSSQSTAQAADDGVRVGAVAAERLQEPEAALQHGRRAGEPVPGQVGRCHAAVRGPAAVDPLDGPAGAVGLQQAGAHAGRDAGGGGAIPASSCPCSIATATTAPTAPQMDDACRPRSKNTELRSSSS